MSQILDLRLNELRKLLEDRAISIELTEPARQLILAAGSDAAYGARPLKRALQRMIQDPLAMKILDGEVLHGAHVRIDVDRNSNQLLRADGPRSDGVRAASERKSKQAPQLRSLFCAFHYAVRKRQPQILRLAALAQDDKSRLKQPSFGQ